mgnify:CR=1 FL=1
MFGFRDWLMNDKEARKYFLNPRTEVSNNVNFELQDGRAIRLVITEMVDKNTFTLKLEKHEYTTMYHGGKEYVWMPLESEIQAQTYDGENFSVTIDGVINSDPEQNYDAIIDRLMEIIPNTY